MSRQRRQPKSKERQPDASQSQKAGASACPLKQNNFKTLVEFQILNFQTECLLQNSLSGARDVVVTLELSSAHYPYILFALVPRVLSLQTEYRESSVVMVLSPPPERHVQRKCYSTIVFHMKNIDHISKARELPTKSIILSWTWWCDNDVMLESKHREIMINAFRWLPHRLLQ